MVVIDVTIRFAIITLQARRKLGNQRNSRAGSTVTDTVTALSVWQHLHTVTTQTHAHEKHSTAAWVLKPVKPKGRCGAGIRNDVSLTTLSAGSSKETVTWIKVDSCKSAHIFMGFRALQVTGLYILVGVCGGVTRAEFEVIRLH